MSKYTSQSVSNYNSNPPADNGAQTDANKVKWSTIKTKLSDPLNSFASSLNSAIETAFGKVFLSTTEDQSTSFTAAADEDGKLFVVTGTSTVTLPGNADIYTGWSCVVFNNGSGTVTLEGSGSDTVNGAASLTLGAGEWCLVQNDGTDFNVLQYAPQTGDITYAGDVTLQADLSFPDAGELTIASGVITPTGVNHTVDTESNAASDDLDTITAGDNGQLLILRTENDARDVVIKHGTGNIQTPAGQDITISDTQHSIFLQYDTALSAWTVLSYSIIRATEAEMEAETSYRFPDAATLKHHPGIAKAWVSFDASGTLAILESYNVSSVTDNGTGDYSPNFTNDFAAATYAAVGMSSNTDVVNSTRTLEIEEATAAVGSCVITNSLVNSATNRTRADNAYISVAFYGAQ